MAPRRSPGRSQQQYGSPETDVKFTGHELNQEGGLGIYHAGARLYDPAIGRFMQQDPLTGMYPGWSPYNYTLGNPLLYVDPDGRAPYRKGEGYISGIRAMELTLNVIKNVFQGNKVQIDFVNRWDTIEAQRRDFTDQSYRTFYGYCQECLAFGDMLNTDHNLRKSELFVNTAFSNQDVYFGGYEIIGKSDGEDVVNMFFNAGLPDGPVVIEYTNIISEINEFLKDSNKQLVEVRYEDRTFYRLIDIE